MIPSAIIDTGATSISGLQGGPFIITNDNPSNIFNLPNITIAQSIKVEKLEHNVQEPSTTIYMVPNLVQHTLLSASKFSGADYISIYNGEKENIYDGQTAKINIPEAAVKTG